MDGLQDGGAGDAGSGDGVVAAADAGGAGACPAARPLITTVRERCRVCYTCVRECPAKAIRIRGGQAEGMAERCRGCGTCVRGCPVGAIEAATRAVDGSRCVACLGCVNTCPAGAMRMQFLGKPVEGFGEFLRRHSIVIAEPPELGPSPT